MSYRIQARPITPTGYAMPQPPRSPRAVLRQLKYRPGACLLAVLLAALAIWLAAVAMRRWSPFQRPSIADLEREMRAFESQEDSGKDHENLRHLILVPGHAVYTGFRTDPAAVRNESNWNLARCDHIRWFE